MVTNVGPVHLELVGTIENVARAKAELIAALPPGGTAVVPDEPLLEPYLGRTDIVVRRVDRRGAGPVPDELHVEAPAREHAHGDRGRGVPRHSAARGRAVVEFSKLREEERPLPGGGLLLNDCYNANPVSMRAALLHLNERAGAAGACSACSARWPSSATTRPPTTARSASSCASSACR